MRGRHESGRGDHHLTMSRALLPAPEVARPERFRIRTTVDTDSALVRAEDQRGEAGSCRVTHSDHVASVSSLEVTERAAGTGLDAALIAAGLQWAETEGAETAVAIVDPDDDPRVFRRLGFMLDAPAHR